MRPALLAWLLATTPALAQTYPFEGRWEQNGNGCHQADVITAREFTSYGSGGSCRFTRLDRVNATTFSFATRCKDETGQYTSSGTMQMQGPNRLLVRDRLMRGQTTTYSRC